MSLTSINKELKEYTREQLIELIADLYKAKNISAREYLEFMIRPDEDKLYRRSLETIAREASRIKRGYGRFRGTKIKLELHRFDAFGTSSELRIELRVATLRFLCSVSREYTFGNPQCNFVKWLLSDTMTLADRNLLLPKYLPLIASAISAGGRIWYNKGLFDELQQTFNGYDSSATFI